MNTTQTTDRPNDAAVGPNVNQPQPPAPAVSSELAPHAGQTGWTDEQIAVLRQIGAEHATKPDLDLFWHYATRTGLDPFTRQVYMIGRDTKIKQREVNPETGNERQVERAVIKFTIQVGIDGWRVLGNRAAHRDGVRVGHNEPLWRGKGGQWQDFWDAEDGAPVACKYTLDVDGVAIVATVNYAEFVQTRWDRDEGGQVPNSMWQKMPANQLAKCAEAAAWRKAFPADFSGLVLEDAAQTEVIDGEVVDAPPQQAAPPKRARGANRLRDRAAKATTKQADDEADPRRKWINRMFGLLGDANVTQRDDQLVVIAELGDLSALPEHRDGIDDDTLRKVVTKLNQMQKAAEDLAKQQPDAPSYEQLVDDAMRSWEVRQASRDEAQS